VSAKASASFAAAVVLAGVGATACASIWGFEDPLDVPAADGGDGATGAGLDGSPMDVVVDRTLAPTDNDAGLVCVPTPPTGWQGPFIIAEASGDPLPTPPPCPSPAFQANPAYDGTANIDAGQASCSCQCGPPSGVECLTATAQFYSDMNCNTPCGARVELGACAALNTGCTPMLMAVALTGATSNGGCPSSSQPDFPPPAWTQSARLCASLETYDAGCSPDRTATLPPLPPFEDNLCVMQAGAVPCPETYPDQKTYYHGTPVDTRSCASCGCAPPSGGTCSGTATVEDNCTGGGAATAPVPTTCHQVPSKANAQYSGAVVDAGSCTPTGGLTGDLQPPSSPTTICCLF
jgi:hypothetical protein